MKRDPIIFINEAGELRSLLINNFTQQEARLVAHYASEFDENTQRRRIAAMLAVPYEFLYPEAPRKPYYLSDGSLAIPIVPPPTPAERALLNAIESYDPVKSLVSGARIEWPVWQPRKLYPASRCVPKSTAIMDSFMPLLSSSSRSKP